MSRSVLKKAKAQKKENAKKKANRKKLIIIGICVLAVVIAAAVIILIRNQSSAAAGTEVYSYGGQSIWLFANGNFTANLAHNTINGAYTKVNESGQTLVYFNISGNQVVGRIINNSLYLPDEWDDGHGHGSVFSRSN